MVLKYTNKTNFILLDGFARVCTVSANFPDNPRTYNEIIGFLFCVHGIMLSLRTLKRTLRRMGLKKNGTEAPISVIVQTVVNPQQQGYINLGYRAMWKLLNVVCGIRATQNTVMMVLKAVTPNNVADRSRHRLQRRIYYNKGPNFWFTLMDMINSNLLG